MNWDFASHLAYCHRNTERVVLAATLPDVASTKLFVTASLVRSQILETHRPVNICWLTKGQRVGRK